MSKFEVYRANTFKEYLEVLNTVTEEPAIKLTPQGLHSVAMDQGHCYMYELNLPSSFFDSWKIEENEKFQINLGCLLKALRKTDKNETLVMEYVYDKITREKATENLIGQPTTNIVVSEDKENEKLKISLISDMTRQKTIDCVKLLEEEIPSPKIFFKNKVRLTMDVFKRILEDFNNNGEHISIEGNDDEVIFRTESDEYKDYVKLDKNSDHILEIRNDETSKATYTINHILPFIKKALKVSEVVTMQFSQDVPLKIDVELPLGSLIFYAAPCIGV